MRVFVSRWAVFWDFGLFCFLLSLWGCSPVWRVPELKPRQSFFHDYASWMFWDLGSRATLFQATQTCGIRWVSSSLELVRSYPPGDHRRLVSSTRLSSMETLCTSLAYLPRVLCHVVSCLIHLHHDGSCWAGIPRCAAQCEEARPDTHICSIGDRCIMNIDHHSKTLHPVLLRPFRLCLSASVSAFCGSCCVCRSANSLSHG